MAENRFQSQTFSCQTSSEPVSEQKATTRAAGVVGLWTSFSRLTGFVRDMVIAFFLGASSGADAFFVAFRIPNLLRRLFAEGALSAAFVPTFVDTLQKDGHAEAVRLARASFTFAAIVLAVVTMLGIIFCPLIVKIIAFGFLKDPAKFDLTVNLTRIMFPYIFFVSLVALASGVLNSMRHFSAPAAAPIILNLSMIFSVASVCILFGVDPSYALAGGVVIGGILQLALQFPFLSRVGVRLAPDFDFRNSALKRVGVLFIPAAFGGAVYQINLVIGTMLASMLPTGSVSWLYYADRLVELPLGIFAISLGTAVLPSMSRQASNGDLSGLSQTVSFSLRVTGFFIIPASVALILLREPLIAVLFQRGQFTFLDTHETASALLWYTVGLWAFSGLKVVVQAFFSLKDTKTPLWIAIGAVLVNLIAGLALMGPMKQGGLALATSLAAAFNVSVLFAILVGRLGEFPTASFSRSIGKICAASAVMGISLFWAKDLVDWSRGLTMESLLVLSGCVAGGAAVFALSAYLFRCRELTALLSQVKELWARRRGGY